MSENARPRTLGLVAAALGGALVGAALARWVQPRAEQVRKPSEDDLRRIGDELARLRSDLGVGSVVRELLDTTAAEAERLAEELEQVYEESFVGTATGSALLRLRDLDRELHTLTAEIRCRLAKT